jgi:threonine/homoserine/homoserine lactone efflux protein
MALTVITVYLGKPDLLMLTIAAVVFVTVNLPTVTIWTVMGQQLSRILTNPKRLRIFNWTMATLLVASLYPLLQMG